MITASLLCWLLAATAPAFAQIDRTARSAPTVPAARTAPASTQAPATPVAQQAPAAQAAPSPRVDGAQLFRQYCATCHGANGEGNIAEHANSLRSASFLSSVSEPFLDYAIRYGRTGSAMAGYHESVGGPLRDRDIRALIRHIRGFAEVQPAAREDRPAGNAANGARIYAQQCARCHGPSGKGVAAPSLNDPLFLMLSGSAFIRHAVVHGRENTQMPSFSATLKPEEIDDVTAHVLTWSRQWVAPKPVTLGSMHLGASIAHPEGPAPSFGTLKNDRYVTPAALKAAIDAKSRMVLVDARPTSAWAESHIPGSVPFPYYDIVPKLGELPTDGTWIVAYCACPTHLSNAVVDALRTHGFKNTAVLDEGYLGWVARGYPLQSGSAGGTSASQP